MQSFALAAIVIWHFLAAVVIRPLVAEGILAAMIIRHPLVAEGIPAGVQISQNCAFYSLKGYVTESNPFIVNSTDIYLAAGGDILDACGHPFNVTVTQVQQTHRCFSYLLVSVESFAHISPVCCVFIHSFYRWKQP